MSAPGTLTWFARHETRLAWRDWLSMITAGRRRRARTVAIALIAFGASMHILAYSMVGRFADIGADADKAALISITGIALMSWSLMLSQALESVTRGFYARSDLDLILSSPAAAHKVFAVRIGTTAASVALMALLLAAPFVNVLTVLGGPQWLCAYGVVAAMGAVAAALAIAIALALFRLIGPKKTRLVAQIVAAVVGAAFVIALQIAAIMSYGELSRTAFLQSDAVVALAPDIGSAVWWPARATLGDAAALAAVLSASLILLGTVIAVLVPRVADHAIAAAGVAYGVTRQVRRSGGFRQASATKTLRRKEWMLLLRDPWLVSQSLMQILYLLPPAFLLWRSFADGSGAIVLVVPVLVMAAGQLSGGLAWLAISGEDAPDLIATAPVPTGAIIRAKVQAVMGAIALVFAPFVLALAAASIHFSIAAAAGIIVSALSATAIQLWFRAQAKRSHFRRRQVSSRTATFAEAFSSIAWAATAALAAAGTWIALFTGLIALAILAGARALAPRQA